MAKKQRTQTFTPTEAVLKDHCPVLFEACGVCTTKQLKDRGNSTLTPTKGTFTNEKKEQKAYTPKDLQIEALLLTAVHRAGFEKGAAYAKLDSLLVVAAKEQLASNSKAARRELRIVTARYNQTQGLKSFSWDLKEMCPTIWDAVSDGMNTKQLESRANKEFTPQRGATAKDGQIEALLRTTVHRAPAFELDAWLDHADNTFLFTVAVTDALDAKIDVVQQEFAKLVAFHVVMCDDEGRDDLLKAYAKFGVKVEKRVAKELFPGTPERVVSEGHGGGGAVDPQVDHSPPITPPAPPTEPSAGLSWKGWGMLLTAGLGLYAYTSINSYLTGDDGEGHLVEL